jgi:hypothetical protein
MKLKKALYGAHQSGRLWEQYCNAKILAIGYKPNPKDKSIFTHTKDSIYSIVLCYVDNFVVCCTATHIKSIKCEILSLFDCKDLGKIKLFLGISITCNRSNHTINLSMELYIKNIVKITDLHNAAIAHTPMSNTQPMLEPMATNDNFPFIALLGRIFWVARCWWPNILFATALLACFSNCFGALHINTLKCIFRYLTNTASIGITYDGNKPFYKVAYSDADFASQYGRKWITGSLVMMGGAAIAWSSKKQSSVSLSTMEAEFLALVNTAKEILLIWQFLDKLGIKYNKPITSPIFCDNQAAIEAIHNPTHKTHAKHMDIAYNFIRDKIHEQKISVTFIPTRDNLANSLTKLLNYNQHWYLNNSILGIHAKHHSYVLGNHFLHTLLEEDCKRFLALLPID